MCVHLPERPPPVHRTSTARPPHVHRPSPAPPAGGAPFRHPPARGSARPPPLAVAASLRAASAGGSVGGRAPRGRFGGRSVAVRWPCGGRAVAVRWPFGGRSGRWPSTSVNRPCYSCKPCYNCNTPPCYSRKPPRSIAGVNPLAAAVAIAVLARANRLASRSVCPRSRSRPPAMPRAPTRPARPWRLPHRLPLALLIT